LRTLERDPSGSQSGAPGGRDPELCGSQALSRPNLGLRPPGAHWHGIAGLCGPGGGPWAGMGIALPVSGRRWKRGSAPFGRLGLMRIGDGKP